MERGEGGGERGVVSRARLTHARVSLARETKRGGGGGRGKESTTKIKDCSLLFKM